MKLKENVKLICTLIVIAFSGIGLGAIFFIKDLKTSYSLQQFMPQNDPLLAADAKVKARFQQKDNFNFLLLVTLPKSETGTWLKKTRLAKAKALGERIQSRPGVLRVISLANVEGAADTKEGLVIGKLVDLTPQAQLKDRVLEDPLLALNLIAKDGRTLVFVVDVKSLSSERLYSLQRDTKKLAGQQFGSATIRVGGIPAIQSGLTYLLKKELARFLAIALLINAGILLLTSSTWSGLVIPMIVIAFANLLALGAQVALGYPFTVLLTTLPILVSLTVLSMGTHSILRLSGELKDPRNADLSKSDIVFKSTRKVFMPNFLTALTSAIGFVVSAFTNVPLLHQYGIVIAVAMVVSWSVVVFLMPALLILLPIPEARDWTRVRARWVLRTLVFPKTIVGGVLVGGAALLLVSTQLNWSPRLFDDLPKNYEARSTTDYIDRKLGGTIPLMIEVRQKGVEAWNEPKSIRKLDQLTQKWRTKKEVGSAVGLSTFLKVMSKGKSKLPTERKEIAETLFLYSLSPENPTRQFLTADGRSTLVVLRLRDVPAENMARTISSFKRDIQGQFPAAEVRVAGMASNAHPMSVAIAKDLVFGFWPSLLVVALVLLAIFRSFYWTFIAILPNLVPPAFLLGVLGLMQTPVKPSLAVVFSVALGLAFNNTVFLIERMRRLRKSDRLPVRLTFYLESNLCLVSTLVVMSGFIIFLLSYFDVNKQFGFYVLLSLVFGLVGDLLFLPAALTLLEQWRHHRAKGRTKINFSKAKENVMPIANQDSRKPAIAAAVAAAFVLILGSSSSEATKSTISGQELLQGIEKQIASRSESAILDMKIIEADGSSKSRKIEIKRMNGEKAYARVRLLSPADLKGTALLSIYEAGNEDQWLYLPSTKQTRRIISSGKQSSFLGSELNFEDFSASSAKNVKSKVMGMKPMLGENCYLVESRLGSENISYSRVTTWISEKKNLPLKAEYYDKGGKLIKVISFQNYKLFGGKIWRAQKMVVKNVQNKRATELVLSDLKVNTKLDAEEFSLSALKED